MRNKTGVGDSWSVIGAQANEVLALVRRDARKTAINSLAQHYGVNATTVQRAARAFSFATAYEEGKLRDSIFKLPLLSVDALARWSAYDSRGARRALQRALSGHYPVVEIIADERRRRLGEPQQEPSNAWAEMAIGEILSERSRLKRVSPPEAHADLSLPVDAWFKSPRELIAFRILGGPTLSKRDYNKGALTSVLVAAGVATLTAARAWVGLPEWASDHRYEELAARIPAGLVSIVRLRTLAPR